MLRHCISKGNYYLEINPRLIPAKMVGFVHYFGIVAMYSYSTIHAKSLGLSASQIGIILAILPVAILFGPPIFCPLADKLQQHRWFLVVFLLLAGAFFMALTFIPEIPQILSNNTYPVLYDTLAVYANHTVTVSAPFSLSDIQAIVSAWQKERKRYSEYPISGYYLDSL